MRLSAMPTRDLHARRRGGVAEARGQARLVSEEPFEPGRVEIDPAGAGVLHAGGMRERHPQQRGARRFVPRGFIHGEQAGDAGHSVQSSVQAFLTLPSPQRGEGVGRAGAEDGDLGAEAGQAGERAQPHPARRQPPRGQDQGGGAPLAMASAPDDQDGVAALHRALQPQMGRGGHRPELVQVHHDQGEPGAADQEIGRAERHPEPAATLHPQQGGEIGACRRGGSRIERVHPVHEGHLPARVVIRAMRARSRLLPPEDRGPTISLSRPGGNRPSRPSIPSRSHPGGGEDSIGVAMRVL